MDWNAARERLAAPIFAPLAPALARLPAERWPTLEELTELARGAETARGKALRFVKPRERNDRERRYYEQHIAETGEVETRENWHDLFNALAWITYPQAKARINAQHAAILGEGGEAEARKRSPERDALTLFDEGGVIVASSSAGLLRHVVDFEWKALFWERREEVGEKMRFFVFGHACYEQALQPYIGMVAKTIFAPVSEFFFMLGLDSQLEEVDRLVASHFASRARFASPKSMAPMPVLGVPGWHFAAQDEAFYDDPDHFRSKRRDSGGESGVIPSKM
jgi:hypothetical protein